MPTYDYGCPKCKIKKDEFHGMSESPVIVCPQCGGKMDKLISPNFGGVIFKGGTPAIHDREKRNRKKRSEQLAQKQKSKYGDLSPRIRPNIAGVETESWSDAQKMAKEAGMNSDSYTPWVEKEKKKKKGIII